MVSRREGLMFSDLGTWRDAPATARDTKISGRLTLGC